MRCQIFHADMPTLISALTDPGLVGRWQGAIGEERPTLADRGLLRHLKYLQATAARVLTCGFAETARLDPAATDALLSDLVAVATWHGWPLPMVAQGEEDVAVDDLPRGLLGADQSDGAGVWRLDHATVALARRRQAAAEADWTAHAPHAEAPCLTRGNPG